MESPEISLTDDIHRSGHHHQPRLLARMAGFAAVIAPVGLLIVLFCLCDSRMAVGKFPEIYTVLGSREE